MTTELILDSHHADLLPSSLETTFQVEQKLREWHSPELLEKLGPVIELSVAAHAGHDGLDGKPLALHCADVTLSPDLLTLEQKQLGLLHDAATPGYTNFTPEEFVKRARDAGCSEKVIAAALCFARPTEGWQYDDWISFLMRDDLTRLTKMADSDAAIQNFPPASENQLMAWKRTRQRLASNESELPETTARIDASLRVHSLPDVREIA